MAGNGGTTNKQKGTPMSVFQGKQGKGAMRVHRAKKVREAVERQAKVAPERRRELRRLAYSMGGAR